jgi:hypothetical protein
LIGENRFQTKYESKLNGASIFTTTKGEVNEDLISETYQMKSKTKAEITTGNDSGRSVHAAEEEES